MLRTREMKILENEMVDDIPIRGTRLLSDVYQRCNIALCEPVGFEEAKKKKKFVEKC